MKSIKLGKHIVPVWLIAVILISVIGGTLGYYVWHTLTLQVEVKEPIEILQYPSTLSLYPGETKEFNVTVHNHASINYSVVLDFQLGNTTYQAAYTTFSHEIYAVVSGEQNLTAWIQVRADAPAMNTTLIINFARGVYPSGLVGYWRFDEGRGGIAFDSSGNDNHGFLNGPAWVDGKYGKALSFDGANDCVEVPPSSSLDIINSVSISAWIYPEALPAYSVILARWYDGTEPDRGMVFQILQGLYVRFGVINDENIVDVPFTFELNKWYYLAATWNGSVSRVYVDGIEIGSRSTSGSFTNQNVNLGIGCDLYPFENSFTGTIDNVMVYNRALSSQEILAKYTS